MIAASPPASSKRSGEGRSWSREELEAFFLGFLSGDVPDYQMSAFLMAVHFRGLSPEELEPFWI